MALQDDLNTIKAQLNAEFPLRQIVAVQTAVPVAELAPTGSYIIQFVEGDLEADPVVPHTFIRYENAGTLLEPVWKKAGGAVVKDLDLMANRASLLKSDLTRTYYPDHIEALAEAVDGDTLILPAPVVTNTAGGAGSLGAIDLPPGISVQTNGFQIGSDTSTGDRMTIRGGKGTIIGNGSLVRMVGAGGGWGLGSYWVVSPSGVPIDYRVQDLNFHASSGSCTALMGIDSKYRFVNCNILQEGGGIAVRMGWGTTTYLTMENCTVRHIGTDRVFNLDKGSHIFRNCTFIYENTSYSLFQNGTTAYFINCQFLCVNRTATTPPIQFNGTPTCTAIFEDCEIISNTPIAIGKYSAGDVGAVTLRGKTVVKGVIEAGITVTDELWLPWGSDIGLVKSNRASLIKADLSRAYYADAKTALAASVSGDTLVLPAPATVEGLNINDAQINLPNGVSLQTNGFQIGTETTIGDAITTHNGKSNIVGNGSFVRVNVNNGAWAIGGGGDATANVRFQDMNIHVSGGAAGIILFPAGGKFEFYNMTAKGSVGGTSGTQGNGMLVRIGWNSAVIATFYNSTFHKLPGTSSNLLSIAYGIGTFYNCTFITESDAFIDLYGGSATFVNCTFLTPNRTSAVKLIKLGSTLPATVTFEDCTIDCNTPIAIYRDPASTAQHTLNLKGMTVIKGDIDPTGITINDTRSNPYVKDVIFTDISPELNTNVDTYYDTFYKVKVTLISDDYPQLISGLTYGVRIDGTTDIPKANITEVNDWITANAPTGTKYWIRRYLTPDTSKGLGPVQVSSNYYKR